MFVHGPGACWLQCHNAGLLGCMEFQAVQEAETTHPRGQPQAGGETLTLSAEPGLRGEKKADTELEMARRGDWVPTWTEQHC